MNVDIYLLGLLQMAFHGQSVGCFLIRNKNKFVTKKIYFKLFLKFSCVLTTTHLIANWTKNCVYRCNK